MPRTHSPKSPEWAGPRRVCFVTGTRAEFGLMRSALRTIAKQPGLRLQIVATGMHLDRSRGHSLDDIRADGWTLDAITPWRAPGNTPSATAAATGAAMASLARAFDELQSDVVLVVGDRVEAFAAAAAAHVAGRLLAHVHGGDRALGQVDDSLRHAITKLAHVHFPATRQSADRLLKLGEDRWRIVRAGSPGLDGIRADAAPWPAIIEQFPGLSRRRFALLLLHPQTSDDRAEQRLAAGLHDAALGAGFDRLVIVYPNNDPGSAGIARCWDAVRDSRIQLRRNLNRAMFLGLLRDAAVLAGNSSSGIIEAASFGTPVIDIGSRQAGRERGANVLHVPSNASAISRAFRPVWRKGDPIRFPARNIYGTGGAGNRIAKALARIKPDRFLRKLIAY